MARMRVFVVLALAVAAGGTFAFATYRFMQTPETAGGTSVPTRPVLVAAHPLNIGAELRAEDLRAVEWPVESALPGTFERAEDIVGRGVILPIAQHEPILPAKLASPEAGAGLPPVIPAGYRALSVRVNDVIGVAGYVLPGTKVDVVATVNPTQQAPDVTSKVILTNVLVLAAGTKIEQDVDGSEPISVSVVTLLVDPAQAERLTLASTEGKIQLALRNPLDEAAPTTPGIRPAALMGTGAAPVRRAAAARPAAPARGPNTVEMIRGDKREREVVTQE